MFFNKKKVPKKRPNKSDVPGSNHKFICPKSKIFYPNVDKVLCNFIKSFPNFETIFDKISHKKNYIFILNKEETPKVVLYLFFVDLGKNGWARL
jgi:hypothetical protein